MKVFISGPITHDPNYKEHFAKAEKDVWANGDIPLNPAVFPGGLTTNEYMSLGLKMIDIADAIYMLTGWSQSRGANIEYSYAQYCGKIITFEPWKDYFEPTKEEK